MPVVTLQRSWRKIQCPRPGFLSAEPGSLLIIRWSSLSIQLLLQILNSHFNLVLNYPQPHSHQTIMLFIGKHKAISKKFVSSSLLSANLSVYTSPETFLFSYAVMGEVPQDQAEPRFWVFLLLRDLPQDLCQAMVFPFTYIIFLPLLRALFNTKAK